MKSFLVLAFMLFSAPIAGGQELPRPNQLVIVLTENFFRSYRGRSQQYVAVVKLDGGKDMQNLNTRRRMI